MLFQMYLDDGNGRLPYVDLMPSLHLSKDPSIVDVLAPYHRGATQVFRCPSDRIMNPSSRTGEYETYYEQEGSSYQYNVMLKSCAGLKLKDTRLFRQQQPELLWLLNDYEPFHGPAGTYGSTNFLFVTDMHVNDLVN